MSERTDKPTVLVVDDERGPRESLRMILAPDYEVLQAGSAAEALEILATQNVDLATLDLNMPGMSGRDLMKEIRSEHPCVEIIVITGCGSIESAAEGVRSGICDYLQKPFDVVQVTASVARALARHGARTRLNSFLEELGGVVGRDRETRAILSDVQRSQKLKGHLGGLLADRGRVEGGETLLDPPRTLEFLEVLAETIETKDRYMRGHARRVAFYASLIADRMQLSTQEHSRVRIAAFLHDIGKVGVPTDLLLRKGALTKSEREIVEQHPDIGCRLLKPLDIPVAVASAVRHHHEWWDGRGYPDGLSGTNIPLAARIISVADAFDTMNADRPYRGALDRTAIVAEFERFAGVQFDPDVVKEFLAILETGSCEIEPELLAEVIAETPRSAGAVAVN